MIGGRVLSVMRDETGAVPKWQTPTITDLSVCCPHPGCGQRVPLVLPEGIDLHHAPDGTQCPETWPDYVLGHPHPGRRPRVTHPIRRRKR